MEIRHIILLISLLIGTSSGCNREEEGTPPPPPKAAATTRDACAGASDGPIAGLPGRVGDYCVDPRADVRRYGVAASSPLDAVCVELFNGECELYKSYGLEGVKTLRYVAKDGSPATVNAVVSSFRRSTGAYGFFTRRVLGDGLPAQVTVKPFAVQGRAVSGIGMSVVWRGKEVVELTYVSEEETPAEIEQRSPHILHPLAKSIAEILVGPSEPERAVLLLEGFGVDELGVSVVSDGLLSVAGTGPGAVGYFSRDVEPHRILVAERHGKEGAEDLLRLLRRSGSSEKLKGRDIVRVRRTQEGAAPETWYLRRNDDVLLAVGPLDVDVAPAQSTPDQRKERESRWEDFATRRLMAVSTRELKFDE